MTTTTHRAWILKASVVNRSGTLTSIASAFSNQGINLDAALALGPDHDMDQGSVAVVFQSTEEQKDFMIRRIQRLPKVTNIDLIKPIKQDFKQALSELSACLGTDQS